MKIVPALLALYSLYTLFSQQIANREIAERLDIPLGSPIPCGFYILQCFSKWTCIVISPNKFLISFFQLLTHKKEKGFKKKTKSIEG